MMMTRLSAILCLLVLAMGAHANLFERTDPQAEVEVGRMVARYIEAQIPLTRDPALQRRVDRVGRAVLARLGETVYPFSFTVLAVSDYNAFTLPGGLIYVFEGLLADTPDDDSLAFVLAHEVAHASHRHWAQQTEKMKTVDLLSVLIIAALNSSVNQVGDIVTLANALVYFQYSRTMEDDADATGLRLIWQAGYDPRGAIRTMESLDALERERGDGSPRFLRDHPPAPDRLRAMRAAVLRLDPASRHLPPVDPSPAARTLFAALPTEAPVANPCYPLASGARWTYRVTGPDGEMRYTERVTDVVRDGDTPVYVVETNWGGGMTARRYVTASVDGLWNCPRGDTPGAWTRALSLSPADPEESIALPCGRVTARKVRQGATDIWVAPGIGIVRRARADVGMTETLVEFVAGE